MGLGQLRGPSCWPDAPRSCPNQISIVIVAHDGSYVNGFRSAVVVMRNPRGPRRDETKSQTGHGAESHPCAKNAQGWGTRRKDGAPGLNGAPGATDSCPNLPQSLLSPAVRSDRRLPADRSDPWLRSY